MGMEKHAHLFEAFNSMAFAGAAVGGKRKVEGGGEGGGEAGGGRGRKGAAADGAGSKRVKREAVTDEAYNAFDWEGMKSTGEGWKKLKVADLQVYLRRHNLPVTGKKDDLIRRIEEHEPAYR